MMMNSLKHNLLRMNISSWRMKKKQYRKMLPAEIAGKKGNDIAQVTGIEGIMFVNTERTSAMGKDLRSVLSLAEYSLFQR